MAQQTIQDLNFLIKEALEPFTAIREEVGRTIVGQEELIESLLISLLTGGHILLEGLPGLAKTLAVNTFAKTINCDFKRIQFTPDLLPADLVGTSIYNPKEGTFSIKKGPLFTNIVLGDEINRAPAKVQSALLEVMQEKQITIGTETFKTGTPFLVLATQNPIEQEGTYPLPEAQTDRFMMKVKIGYPDRTEEKEIMYRMAVLKDRPPVKPVASTDILIKARELIDQIYVDDKITEYILNIVFSTRNPEQYHVPIEGLLEFGASPRASLALLLTSKAHAFLQGRGFVTPHDIKSVAHPVLRHRIKLSYEAEAESLTTDILIDRILDSLLVP